MLSSSNYSLNIKTHSKGVNCCWLTVLTSPPHFPSGTILTSLQFSFTLASLAYLPTFTKIYQGTLTWFPGFVFLMASVFTVLAMIPIRYSVCTVSCVFIYRYEVLVYCVCCERVKCCEWACLSSVGVSFVSGRVCCHLSIRLTISYKINLANS